MPLERGVPSLPTVRFVTLDVSFITDSHVVTDVIIIMCAHPLLNRCWAPNPDQLAAILQEGAQIANLVGAGKLTPALAGDAIPGVADVQDARNHVLGGVFRTRRPNAAGPAWAVGDAGAGSSAGAAAAGGSATADNSQGDTEVKELRKALEALQLDLLEDRSKDQKDKKKKHKKRSRGRSRSSSRSSSSRRRKRSHSSSKSRSGSRRRRRFLQWDSKAKDRAVSPRMLSRIETEKFKGRSVLLAFAQKYPGALTAAFINNIRQKLRGGAGMVTRSKQLREIDVTRWVTDTSELSELRDKREAVTIATMLNFINADQAAHAMDVGVMRLQALQTAKTKGGSWEKASKGELIPESGGDVRVAGVSGLMQ